MVHRKSHLFLQSADDLAEIQETTAGLVLLVIHKDTDYWQYVDCCHGKREDGWSGFRIAHYEMFSDLGEAMKCLMDSGKSWAKVPPKQAIREGGEDDAG